MQDIELIRQVLASASRAKLPRAEEAMDALARINAKEIEAMQQGIEDQDVCNGVCAHG